MAKDRVKQGISPFQLAVGTSNQRKMYGDEEEEKRQKKTKKEKNKELRLEFLHSSLTSLEVLMVGMLIYLSV
jgi:hypothetical protein